MVLVSLFSFDFEREWDIRDITVWHITSFWKNRWWASELVAVILRQYHKRTTQETTSWYCITCPYISGQQLNPGACAGRKLGEKAKHRVEAKIAPLANIMRYHDRPSWDVTRLHESAPKLEESMSQYVPICPNMSQYVPICPNIFSITPNMSHNVHHISLWWSLMCFGDLMVSPSSPELPRVPSHPRQASLGQVEVLRVPKLCRLYIFDDLYKNYINIEWISNEYRMNIEWI